MTTGHRRQMAVRAPDPRLRRRRQLIAAGVIGAAFVLVLLIGLLLFGGGSAPQATPSFVAVGSARPTASVAATVSAVATPSALATRTLAPPTATAVPTASIVPTAARNPSPAATASSLGASIARDATFSLLGIDDKVAPEAIPRRITFNVDGAGDIRVDLSDVTAGTVRMCLYQSDGSTDPTDADCTITDGGSLTKTPTAAGPWTIWLFGDEPGRSPTATLRVRWSASAAALQLADFRFQGADSPNYTGFQVRVMPSAAGQLSLDATWDDGQGGDYPYTITLTDLDGTVEPPMFTGDSDHATAVRDVVAGGHYQAEIDNTSASVIDQVLLRATVTWP